MPAWEINSPVFISSVWCWAGDGPLGGGGDHTSHWGIPATLVSALCLCICLCAFAMPNNTIWPFIVYDAQYNLVSGLFFFKEIRTEDFTCRCESLQLRVSKPMIRLCSFLTGHALSSPSDPVWVCDCPLHSDGGFLLLKEALWKSCLCSTWTFPLLTLSTAKSSRRECSAGLWGKTSLLDNSPSSNYNASTHKHALRRDGGRKRWHTSYTQLYDGTCVSLCSRC